MPWTRFWDMHSGGGQKLRWPKIFIEAPQAEAEIIFYNFFHRNPNRITCTCCGPDYSIDETEDLAQATAYYRGCAYDSELGKYVEKPDEKLHTPYISLEEFLRSDEAYFIHASDIPSSARVGTLPREGYVWVGEDD